ncbi:hypothetical protein [Streptomyces olivaceiscleroticus]|uniref:Uncharacterized protein n=1 Tax=Streptomyces olivaceiscleroticus TaxID=68245 RepID=A0ABN1BMS3_9ACTN
MTEAEAALADILAGAGNSAGAQIEQTTDQSQTQPQDGGTQ